MTLDSLNYYNNFINIIAIIQIKICNLFINYNSSLLITVRVVGTIVWCNTGRILIVWCVSECFSWHLMWTIWIIWAIGWRETRRVTWFCKRWLDGQLMFVIIYPGRMMLVIIWSVLSHVVIRSCTWLYICS